MAAEILFMIILAIGGGLLILGRKASDKSKLILMLIGVLMFLIGGYGVFTSLI